MSRSIWIALVLVVGIVGFFTYGTLFREPSASAGDASDLTARRAASEPKVLSALFVDVEQEPHAVFLNLKGTTEPDRVVTVRSQTTGMVASAPISDGRFVNSGTLLCGLDVAAREARIAEAEAAVRSATLDFGAARRLADKGWTSEGQAASAKAALDSANAALDAAQIELGHTKITAPFSGIFEQRMAERGDFLTVGGACGMIVDLDPIKISVDASETYAGNLTTGQIVEARLSNGSVFEGKISFIARTADSATRTFRVVAEAPNPERAIAAGLSADLKISVGETLASPISSALLTLHDDGRVGVRHIDSENKVRFADVSIIDDAGSTMWVTGLPGSARILTPGQDYLSIGAEVTPLLAEAAAQ